MKNQIGTLKWKDYLGDLDIIGIMIIKLVLNN